jgi:N-acetylglutamate synthase-like GNAT family acetyltransferase
MNIRFADQKDIVGILELYKQLNPEEIIIALDKAEEIWEDMKKSNYQKYIIAEENFTIVSSCNISIIHNLTRNGKPYAVIENVITDEKHRRKGIGRMIMSKAIEYAKEAGCYKVILLSSIKRKEAHDFYEKAGFNGNSKKGFEYRF